MFRFQSIHGDTPISDAEFEFFSSLLGPFVTPKVVDYLGLAYSLARETLEIRFALDGGQEIRLPIHRLAFDELLDFAAAHSKKLRD